MSQSKTLSEFKILNETFKNFIGPESVEDRKKWADEVWNLLQDAYKTIGGIKGSGFNSVDDMVKTIPFWKIFVKDGKIIVVILYKEKSGRKAVALATNGSPESKVILADVFKNLLGTAWGEKSKSVLNFMMKSLDINILRAYLLKPSLVAKLMPDEEILKITPEIINGFDKEDIKIYRRYGDVLKDYLYVREIGGTLFLKVALGTPNKTIV